MIGRLSLLLFLACDLPCALHAQSEGRPQYSRKNTFSITGAYSDTSSHIIGGMAMNRKLATIGVSYTHRIDRSPYMELYYLAELHPVVLESDPTATLIQTYNGPPAYTGGGTSTVALLSTKCPANPPVYTGTLPPGGPSAGSTYTITSTYICGGRRWTYGQAFSPLGLRLNLLPRRRLQPVFSLAGGYLFSTRPIPIAGAGSYNFTLEIGGGLEFYLRPTQSESLFGNRSLRVEYRFHHISNADTANSNPGIENGLLQVAFSFGR
ncbi:MAG: acyloxyacyl hydrolase [Acidobacteriaceae bacterium]|nr:acyloxyacyl hydrolase [Acidobacteriaceae bacterium]